MCTYMYVHSVVDSHFATTLMLLKVQALLVAFVHTL